MYTLYKSSKEKSKNKDWEDPLVQKRYNDFLLYPGNVTLQSSVFTFSTSTSQADLSSPAPE